MSENTNYNVNFTASLGILLYKDSLGTLEFYYEIGGKSFLYLSKHPRDARGQTIDVARESQVAQERLALALERTKQFLLSCGYRIEMFPE